MNRDQAEEYTEALGQSVAGSWRQAALGEALGVPAALGLTTREWVEQRLGGYLKLSVTRRREAVDEMTEEGFSKRQIAGVLGVGSDTVASDRRAARGVRNHTPDDEPHRETICPTCQGTGWVPLREE